MNTALDAVTAARAKGWPVYEVQAGQESPIQAARRWQQVRQPEQGETAALLVVSRERPNGRGGWDRKLAHYVFLIEDGKLSRFGEHVGQCEHFDRQGGRCQHIGADRLPHAHLFNTHLPWVFWYCPEHAVLVKEE